MKTKFVLPLFALALAGLFGAGCSSTQFAVRHASNIALAGEAVTSDSAEVRAERMLIWRGALDLEVWNVSNAVAQAAALVQQQGGFVEQKSGNEEASASLRLRVPVAKFKAAVGALEELGTVTRRHISSEDVTEQYVDVEARLKNKVALRDRLKQLLDKATGVKDVLAIETELNRVQSDIDAMTARLKVLKGQADLATLEVSFTRKAILGPLGYVCQGLWWCVEKLFVIRD
jgi:hypothetical protein